MAKKKGLGRGLDALFNSNVVEESESVETTEKKVKKSEAGGLLEIDVVDIKPNSSQPRKVFNEESIIELADSIRESGLIQPIVVKKISKGYELVSGERRLRAVIKLKQKKIKAIVIDVDERKKAIFSIIENIQREDLNPIDEAKAFTKLKEDYSLTQEKLSDITGKSREYIANLLRLLNNTKYIIKLIEDGTISMGMGRTLLGIKDEKVRDEVARKTVENKYSVRDVEKMIKALNDGTSGKIVKNKVMLDDVFTAEIEEKLKKKFGIKAMLKINSEYKGKIEFNIKSKEVLEDAIEKLLKD